MASDNEMSEFTIHPKHCQCALLRGLKKQRQENQFCDITVIVGNKRFPLHRCLLSMMCNYFEVMFNSDFKEAAAPEVIIEEGSSDAFGRLMDFAYSGTLHVPPDMIVDITQMACYLQFSYALESCVDVFEELCKYHKKMNVEIAFQMSLLAQNYGLELKDVVEQSAEYLISKFPQFCKLKMFLTDVTADFLEIFLEKDDLTALADDMTEVMVLEAVTDWLKYKWEKRKEHAEKLLKKIRLGTIAKPQLTMYITETMREDPGCRELVKHVLHVEADADHGDVLMFKPRGVQVLIRLNTWASRNGTDTVEYYHPKYTGRCPAIILSHDSKDVPISIDSINGQLYAGIRRGVKLRTFVKLLQETGEWKELPVIDRSFVGGVIVHLNNHLYAVGGLTPIEGINYEDEMYGDEVIRFNVETEKWEEVPLIPTSGPGLRGIFAPAVIAYKGYLFVQVDEGVTSDTNLYVYNPCQNSWHKMCNLLLTYRFCSRFVIDNGRLYRLVLDENDDDLEPEHVRFLKRRATVVQELVCTGFDNFEQFSVTIGDEKVAQPDDKRQVWKNDIFAINDRIFFDLNRHHLYKSEGSVEDWESSREELDFLPYAESDKEYLFFCMHTLKKIKWTDL